MKKFQLNNSSILLIVTFFTVLVLSILFLSKKTEEKFDKILIHKEASKNAYAILSNCYEMEASVRGYSLTKNKKVIETYMFAKSHLINALNNYLNQTNIDSTHKLDSLVFERINLIENQIILIDSNSTSTKNLEEIILLGDKLMDDIRLIIFNHLKVINIAINGEIIDLKQLQNKNNLFIIILTLFVSIIMILSFITLHKKNEQNEKLRISLLDQKQQIEIRNNELEIVNEELQQFAYIASHDLQEPLRKIRMFSQLLIEEFKEAENNPYIVRIENAAERMQQLIEDLLSYSRISRNTGENTHINFNDCMNEVLDNLSILIEENNTEVSVDKFEYEIKAKPIQIKQLFQNLLSNAIKFSAGKDAPKVTITNEIVTKKELPINIDYQYIESEKFIKINVIDNGIGFDEQYAEKIFTIFQRLHGKKDYRGTGIGLAICEKICENHNGYINAKSSPGNGANFSVFLPI